MGWLYRPKLRSGKLSSKWWVKYYVNGRPVRESTGTEKESQARRFLKLREGAVATGAPIPPRIDRIIYDELASDLRQHYKTTGRRSMVEVEQRLTHLDRFFRGRRAASIGPPVITAHVAQRQAAMTRRKQLTSNRTINIELALLRRMFRLAYKNGKVLRVPPIEMLEEAPPQGVGDGVQTRLPADRRAKHGAGQCAALGGDEADRPQDRECVPALCDRERFGPPGRFPEVDGHVFGHVRAGGA